MDALSLVSITVGTIPKTKLEWLEQRCWYVEGLAKFEADNKIRAVYVFTHHPPFTNSKQVSDNKNVQETFVAPFLGCKKTRAFFSGHHHSYERLEHGDKLFLVTGGGGGPRFLNKKQDKARHKDWYQGREPRPFHYVKVVSSDRETHFSVYGLEKNEIRVRRIDEFKVKI